MFRQKTIEEFINETSSGIPTPGGGSVSALVGALGAALSSMVGELSVAKDEDRVQRLNMQGKVRICKDLIESFLKGMDEDVKAFDAVMAAYRMPKDTDDDKKIRSSAIQQALVYATEAPYEMALLCIDAMNISADMLKYGNKNAASDAAVSGYLGYAALNGCLYNMKINLNSIKDRDYVDNMRSKVEELYVEGENLLSKVKSLSNEKIG